MNKKVNKAKTTRKLKEATPKGPQYDGKKLYRWQPEDVFELKGTEFGTLFNTLMKEKVEILTKLELISLMENMLKKAVEAGVAKEIPQEEIKAAQAAKAQ